MIKCQFTIVNFIVVVSITMTSCQETAKERCAREVVEYTAKNCPARVSADITLDSLNFNKVENCIGYFYTVSGVMDSIELMQEKETEMYDVMKKQIRNSTELRFYKELGVGFAYVYFSRKHPNLELLKLKYSEQDYR